jgi:hypothetical protein
LYKAKEGFAKAVGFTAGHMGPFRQPLALQFLMILKV